MALGVLRRLRQLHTPEADPWHVLLKCTLPLHLILTTAVDTQTNDVRLLSGLLYPLSPDLFTLRPPPKGAGTIGAFE